MRIRPGHRVPGLAGMPGVVVERWGSPEHPAFDVRLEDGQRRLFWSHELEEADGAPGRLPTGPSAALAARTGPPGTPTRSAPRP